MPHISVKMLKGRSEEQKKRLAAALVRALTEELHCSDHYVTCTVEDYSAVEWQTVFQREIAEKPVHVVYKKAEYDPKSLL
mgnify:FL=1